MEYCPWCDRRIVYIDNNEDINQNLLYHDSDDSDDSHDRHDYYDYYDQNYYYDNYEELDDIFMTHDYDVVGCGDFDDSEKTTCDI